MRYRANQRPSCRLLTKRKVIRTWNDKVWHEWRDGDGLVIGPNDLASVAYEDGICVKYLKGINSIFVPSEQAFGHYIGWNWNGMAWTYYIQDDHWDFLGTPDSGMRELCPDLKRLPLASDDIKILMELTYG